MHYHWICAFIVTYVSVIPILSRIHERWIRPLYQINRSSESDMYAVDEQCPLLISQLQCPARITHTIARVLSKRWFIFPASSTGISHLSKWTYTQQLEAVFFGDIIFYGNILFCNFISYFFHEGLLASWLFHNFCHTLYRWGYFKNINENIILRWLNITLQTFLISNRLMDISINWKL